MDKHLKFWEEDCTFETASKWFKHTGDFKKLLREYIKDKGYKSVLDVGAGTGTEYDGFTESGYQVDYTAADITPKFVTHMKDRGIKAHCCDITNLPFEKNSFDVVICYGVMNHQTGFKKQIDEVLRVTNGEAIISFFKPFVEAVTSENDYGNFTKTKFDDGVIVQRHNKFIYNHFSQKKMEQYFCENSYEFVFKQVADVVVLFIRKGDK